MSQYLCVYFVPFTDSLLYEKRQIAEQLLPIVKAELTHTDEIYVLIHSKPLWFRRELTERVTCGAWNSLLIIHIPSHCLIQISVELRYSQALLSARIVDANGALGATPRLVFTSLCLRYLIF